MSTRPNPAALTAAMLLEASYKVAYWGATKGKKPISSAYECAQLASAIHRLAPACKRLAEAECNGEWRDGQRAHWAGYSDPACVDRERRKAGIAALEQSITDYATRLDKRIAKLNAQLGPFGYQLWRKGDPRGATLCMAELTATESDPHYAIG